MNDETLHDLAALREREPTPASVRNERDPKTRALAREAMPELLSIENRPTGSPVRTYLYQCGHQHATILLAPPKDCPACREARFARGDQEALLRRTLVLMARTAAERAETAHAHGKPHLICERCVDSVKADVGVACERLASIWSKRVPRGFR